MNVLVTGAAGRLGREVASQLAPHHAVVGLDRAPGHHVSVVADVTDRDAVRRACHGCEAVVHTASLHAPHLATHTRRQFIDVNVLGTLNVLEAAAEAGVRRVVYTSTTSIYGHALEADDEAVWVTEAVPTEPRDAYDVTKAAAEGLCRDVARTTPALSCIALRVSRFFPEPDRLAAVHRMSRSVDVRDAAEAHVLALTATVDVYDVVNVSARSPFLRSDTRALWEDPAGLVRHRLPDVADAFARRGWALPDRIDRVYAVGKAERVLGFRPRHDVLSLLSESDPK